MVSRAVCAGRSTVVGMRIFLVRARSDPIIDTPGVCLLTPVGMAIRMRSIRTAFYLRSTDILLWSPRLIPFREAGHIVLPRGGTGPVTVGALPAYDGRIRYRLAAHQERGIPHARRQH